MAKNLLSPRPQSSLSSSKFERMSKQAFLRANDLKQFERETIMTPLGFKTVRIYTAADENRSCMDKYCPRPKTAIGIEKAMESNNMTKNEILPTRTASANEMNKLKQKDVKQIKRPETASSTLSSSLSSSQSSSSSRQIIFNSRHPSCSPPNLYLHDKLRSNARKNRQKPAPSRPCEERSSVEGYNTVKQRQAKSADVLERFGTLVHCPKFVKGNSFLTHDDLDIGQKQYIWGMAKVYSVDKMKSLRQRHYQSILNYEYTKRVTTRGVEKKDRIKLWKEYLEYQKLIDRFGKNDPKKYSKIMSLPYGRPHSHAKKHKIVGWTTEITENEIDDRSREFDKDNLSSNDDSFIYTDDETTMSEEEEKSMLKEKLCLSRNYDMERPKSSKYKIRKPLTSTRARDDAETIMQDIEVDEILSGDVHDKLSLQSEEDNFI